MVGSCFTNKHYTRLENLANDKSSNLVQKFVNYGRKKFYNIGPWAQGYKTFYVHKLRTKKAYNIGPRAQYYITFLSILHEFS
jgi:hypothetical protein